MYTLTPLSLSLGTVRYFRASRCWNTPKLRRFNQGKIQAEELVTLDCGLLELEEVAAPDFGEIPAGGQMLAAILRPEIKVNPRLKREFSFCGYDLVETMSCISAITNCGGEFASIAYDKLNQYGLIPTYREAVAAQRSIYEEDPEEPHAYCEIVELWRRLPTSDAIPQSGAVPREGPQIGRHGHMKEKIFETSLGGIHYWVNDLRNDRKTLVFLPGLTADHRLFGAQMEHFREQYNVLTWDAPGHAASWPFSFDFDLMDKARWLDGILTAEGIGQPILVGQSMGGYVAQAYCQLFPEKVGGFVAIDSAPLQRKFTTAWEIWLLKRMEPVYRYWPWKSLLRWGTQGVSTTDYGRRLMRDMMMVYDGDQKRYARLSGHGMAMLAQAMEADLPYQIPCPALLLCGERDRAGSCIRYAKAWRRDTGIPLHWIPGAGHNSNTDQPELVNGWLEKLIQEVEST